MANNKNTVVERVVTTTEIEAPYELPEGWKWCRLQDCSSIISKGTTPKGGKDAYVENGINFLRIENLNDDGSINLENISHITLEEHTNYLKRSILEEGDLLISIAGTLGKVGFVEKKDLPINTNQAIAFVRLYKNLFNNMYLKYAIESPFINAELISKTKVTSIPNLTLDIISNCTIPLPPTLEEQQRIVNRIETLFEKLDQAKEKAQNVVDTFETRKASILHKAFNNQLKIDNGELKDEDWVETTIGETVKLLSGQDFKPEDYNDSENGIPYITGASNFDNNHVIINRWTENPTVIARKNDVLLVCKGSGYGKTIIADFEEAHIARQIMSLQPNEKINNKYIWYLLQNNYEYLRNGGQGLIPGISRSIVLDMKIKLPPINYQLSIVNFLDVILEKETKAKESAEAVLEQIDLLKKSILARAFRGEL